MKVLTEAELRKENCGNGRKKYYIPKGTLVTPSAMEYLHDHGICLRREEEREQKKADSMTVHLGDGTKKGFIDAVSGEYYQVKPEYMTHLRGNLLVTKTHARIELRGRLDGLQAEILLFQARQTDEHLRGDLGDILKAVREILAAEVKEEPVSELRLFGLSLEQIHAQSHDVRAYFGMNHPIPSAEMPEKALELNLLRTEVRKAELSAARAFPEGEKLGILEGLNRLSSGVYVLFCRVLSGHYK